MKGNLIKHYYYRLTMICTTFFTMKLIFVCAANVQLTHHDLTQNSSYVTNRTRNLIDEYHAVTRSAEAVQRRVEVVSIGKEFTLSNTLEGHDD